MNASRLYGNWIKVTSVAITFVGVAIAFFVQPTVLPIEQGVSARWILGLLGSTMIGWGATIFLVAQFAFAYRKPQLLDALLIGVLGWFVPDSSISAYFGAYFNIGINIIILVAALVPLVSGRRLLK